MIPPGTPNMIKGSDSSFPTLPSLKCEAPEMRPTNILAAWMLALAIGG